MNLRPFLISGILAAGIFASTPLPQENIPKKSKSESLALEKCLNEKTLPRIMREQLESLGIEYDSVPLIEVDYEGKVINPINPAKYEEATEKIIVSNELLCPDNNDVLPEAKVSNTKDTSPSFEESIDNLFESLIPRTVQFSEETIAHELCHAYTHQRTKKLLWPTALSLTRNEDEVKVLDAYGAFFERIPETDTLEYISWKTDLSSFETIHLLSLSRSLIIKMLGEGIAEYCSGEEVAFFSFKNIPHSFLDITLSNMDAISYRGGYHFIKPLMDEFGVQPVVDYIIQNPPEVTGNLREDVVRYQKEIREGLRGEK